jgi:hypothetical protein
MWSWGDQARAGWLTGDVIKLRVTRVVGRLLTKAAKGRPLGAWNDPRRRFPN